MTALTVPSPIGPLTVREEDGAIISVDWQTTPGIDETTLLLTARDQLAEYFSGARQQFDLPLRPSGTTFQQRVWQALTAIPYGQTRTYGEIARIVATAPRALGGACGRNPIPILIPCHRVLSATGAIGGYSGLDGTRTKVFLLGLEGGQLPAPTRGAAPYVLA
jgi:methylated-DNA-[protein]-cysteine S-methyltransferase